MAKKNKEQIPEPDNTKTEQEQEQEFVPEAPAENPELTQALEQARDLLDKYQRTLAEFDNFRKRTIKEKASMRDLGVCETIEFLLPIIDNFERAFAAAPNKDDAFYVGISLIFKQMQDFLDSFGVEAIKALGSKFDPSLHNAIAHTEDENYGENEIIEEMQKGYIYKDKVIRASMVKVAN